MRREKERNARYAVVEIGPKAGELERIGIAEPVEADPGGARSSPDGVRGNFAGNFVGLGGENIA